MHDNNFQLFADLLKIFFHKAIYALNTSSLFHIPGVQMKQTLKQQDCFGESCNTKGTYLLVVLKNFGVQWSYKWA